MKRLWALAIFTIFLGASLVAAVDYPSAVYDPTSPSSKRDSSLTQSEWNALQDEVGAVETALQPDYQKRGTQNQLQNGSVETWTAGTSSAPDTWTLSGTGAAVARQSDGQDGSYSAQITAGSAASKLEQTPVTTISSSAYTRLRSTPFTLTARVKTSTASACRLQINDGVGSTQSSYHTGGGAWEFLSVVRTLDSSATALNADLLNDKTDSSTTCRFDTVMLFEGKFPQRAFSDRITSTSGGGSSKPFMSWTANQAILPATTFPDFNTVNDHPVLQFDASTKQCAYFGGVLPSGYAGGGLTVDIVWAPDSATSNNTIWLTAFERFQDDTLAITSDSFGTELTSSASAATAAATVQYVTNAHSSSQVDSLAAGEGFRLRVCRDAANGSDNMTGSANVLRVDLKEP